MPGIYIRAFMDDICDPESLNYNPDGCDFVRDIFTDTVIDDLNEEWNTYITDFQARLPMTAHTHQLAWPLSGLGSVTLDDNDWDWPALYAPRTGEYLMTPLLFPHSVFVGPNGFWALVSGGVADGRIQRELHYDMEGEFYVGTELFFGFRGLLLMVGFGSGGPYNGYLQ